MFKYPVVFFMLLCSQGARAEMIYLDSGDIYEGRIVSRNKSGLILETRKIQIVKKNTQVKKIRQKKGPAAGSAGRNFGKVTLKDKTSLSVFWEKDKQGDVLLYGHSYLPDGYKIRAAELAGIVDIPKVLVRRNRQSLAMGFLTDKAGARLILEEISFMGAPELANQGKSNLKEINYKNIIKMENQAPGKIPQSIPAAPRREAFFKWDSGELSFAFGYFRTFNALESRIPQGSGFYIAYEPGRAFQPWSGNNPPRKNYFIPGLRLEAGYQRFTGQAFVGLTSFNAGAGPVWNLPFFSFSKITGFFALACGVSYERIYFYQQKISGADFMAASVLGLKYTFGKVNLSAHLRLGYSYDEKAPHYFSGLGLGAGYGFY